MRPLVKLVSKSRKSLYSGYPSWFTREVIKTINPEERVRKKYTSDSINLNLQNYWSFRRGNKKMIRQVHRSHAPHSKWRSPGGAYGVFPSSCWQSTTSQNESTFPLFQRLFSSETTIAFLNHHLTHKEQLKCSKKLSIKSLHGPANEDFASLNSEIGVIFQKKFSRATSLLPLFLQNQTQSSVRFLGLILIPQNLVDSSYQITKSEMH